MISNSVIFWALFTTELVKFILFQFAFAQHPCVQVLNLKGLYSCYFKAAIHRTRSCVCFARYEGESWRSRIHHDGGSRTWLDCTSRMMRKVSRIHSGNSVPYVSVYNKKFISSSFAFWLELTRDPDTILVAILPIAAHNFKFSLIKIQHLTCQT